MPSCPEEEMPFFNAVLCHLANRQQRRTLGIARAKVEQNLVRLKNVFLAIRNPGRPAPVLALEHHALHRLHLEQLSRVVFGRCLGLAHTSQNQNRRQHSVGHKHASGGRCSHLRLEKNHRHCGGGTRTEEGNGGNSLEVPSGATDRDRVTGKPLQRCATWSSIWKKEGKETAAASALTI